MMIAGRPRKTIVSGFWCDSLDVKDWSFPSSSILVSRWWSSRHSVKSWMLFLRNTHCLIWIIWVWIDSPIWIHVFWFVMLIGGTFCWPFVCFDLVWLGWVDVRNMVGIESSLGRLSSTVNASIFCSGTGVSITILSSFRFPPYRELVCSFCITFFIWRFFCWFSKSFTSVSRKLQKESFEYFGFPCCFRMGEKPVSTQSVPGHRIFMQLVWILISNLESSLSGRFEGEDRS